MSYPKNDWKVALAIVLVTSLYCLHLIRNILPSYPYIVWVVTLACSVAFFARRKIDRLGVLLLSLLATAMIYVVLVSFVQIPDERYLLAIGRFVFVWPYAAFILAVLSDWSRVRLALQTFAVWVAVSGCSIVVQTMFGEVDWFALPAIRDNSIRYSSLAGSLTVFGIVGGFSLPIIFFFFKGYLRLRVILMSLTSLGLLLGLQKAAIVNVSIFFGGLAIVLLLQSMNFLKPFVLRARDGIPIVGAFLAIVGFSYLEQQDMLPKAPPPKIVANSGDFLQTRENVDVQKSKAGSVETIVTPEERSDEKQRAESGTPADQTKSEVLRNEPERGADNSARVPEVSIGPSRPVEDPSIDNRLQASANSPNAISSLKTIVGGRDDVGINEGLRGRLVQLPAVLFQKYGLVNMLTGVGLVGGAGALGFTEAICDKQGEKTVCADKYPMAHNGFIELLALGGIGLLTAVLLVIGVAAFRIFLAIKAGEPYLRDKIATLFALVLLSVNTVGGAAILYQPYFAVALYLLTIPAIVGSADAERKGMDRPPGR